MVEFPGELHYAKSHEWVRVEDDGSVTIGIFVGLADAKLGRPAKATVLAPA